MAFKYEMALSAAAWPECVKQLGRGFDQSMNARGGEDASLTRNLGTLLDVKYGLRMDVLIFLRSSIKGTVGFL